ncbi:MAG TPA: hypothetical protein VLK30_02655 [Candidatus Limnocylindrales bacterium]|nr:hypothetical protein [Candidatus Limnocylindrales bacterium]
MAGDLSPLTIEASDGARRTAPPALVVGLAVGLGSVDMPVPSVAEWEWLNWKFPRAVHAGDTIYARWTLTQKRPPLSGAPTSIVVWRVDVHTADGVLCAEGEVGAKVKRTAAVAPKRPAEQPPAVAAATPRRRRRRSRANGTTVPEPPAIAAPAAPEAKPERAAGGSRRRRRRRSSGSSAQKEEHEPRAAQVVETSPPPPSAVAASSPAAAPKGIGGVLRRLRRP